MTDLQHTDLQRPDLAALTGVRSGKRSYYRAYVRSDERTQRAVRAMDSISRAVVRTVEGPRGLIQEVVGAAAEHLSSPWTMLALTDGCLPGARPRFLVVGPDGSAYDEEADLPSVVRRELVAIRAGVETRTGPEPGWVRAPLVLEGMQVGELAAIPGLADEADPDDHAILRILANQAAVSLHTSEQYQAGTALHRRAQLLYDEAQARARDLERRTGELRAVEQRLAEARQREVVDAERHRIARELHDSVTQYVLSAGMAVEMARGDAADLGEAGERILAQLATAKQLSQEAVEQLRRAIYALHRAHDETTPRLVALVREVAEHCRPELSVEVRSCGEELTLRADAHHEIARAVGEALFNVAAHAHASRAVVRLRYAADLLTVSVTDDGDGDPAALHRKLRIERGSSVNGRHRGLVNIEARITDLGGAVTFGRARLGGVRVEMAVPLPLPEAVRPGLIDHLLSGPDHQEEQCRQ
ncbi:histidine kinase [Marmoricola endophyticus]|uniref:histidine kinase n=1 Tax=Marmoricola endophyticus TaxID=2040280 RepID=A0A917F8N1_9ACTN|nr:histidine kinase [Marmoricola endophyticus]GGF53644.1 histidine kinase [Marmoricola endophyticus]